MKVFDCITYYNEPLLFNLRLNILNKFVDEFVVCEANFTHSGEKKKINFKAEDYPKFKNRITHLIVDREPNGLINITKDNKHNNSLFRLNAAKRIEHQRNYLIKHFKEKKIDINSWVIYSDSDEIPNLEDVSLSEIKEKILLFRQDVFHYKFNLLLPAHDWFGSKACRLKNLNTFSLLRNIKTKKYHWLRLDTLFKKDKYISLKIVKKGGWHFTELKTPDDIFQKHKNDEHHDEFDLTGIGLEDIQHMIKNRYIPYDHSADKKSFNSKWNKNNRVKLLKINDDKLPKYLIENKRDYLNWFDN